MRRAWSMALPVGMAFSLGACPPSLAWYEFGDASAGRSDGGPSSNDAALPTDASEPDAMTSASPPCTSGVGNVTALSLGPENTCAVADGKLFCWGSNSFAVVETGGGGASTPMRIGETDDWVEVSVDAMHACGIRLIGSDRQLYCWGDDGGTGRLGTGNTGMTGTPAQEMTERTDWLSVDVGRAFTCATTLSYDVYCWGLGDYLGRGDAQETSAMPLLVDEVSDGQFLTIGSEHSCVRAGLMDLRCWGGNEFGRTGFQDATSGMTYTPRTIDYSAASEWFGLSAGDDHTCALLEGAIPGFGDVVCWGSNSSGQLGFDSDSEPSPLGDLVEGTSDFNSVSAGGRHTCGTRDLELYCWGERSEGAVGAVGTGVEDESEPTMVPGEWSLVAAGELHTCAVTGGYLYCWGTDSRGSLGVDVPNGTIRSTPQPVCIPDE